MSKKECNITCRDHEIKDSNICCLYCSKRQSCSAVCKDVNCNK